MMKLEIKVTGLKEFVAKIDSSSNVKKTINRWIKKIIFFLQWEAIVFTPVDTWLLRNSFKQTFWDLFWELFNIRKYWIFVHEWTRYIKKPKPFMTKAVNENQWKIEVILNNEILNNLSILQ